MPYLFCVHCPICFNYTKKRDFLLNSEPLLFYIYILLKLAVITQKQIDKLLKLCYIIYATHFNIFPREGNTILVKMYSLTFSWKECVATWRDSFFGASLARRIFL